MTVLHQPISRRRGDTWRINGTMLDEYGAPIDLSDAVVEWALVDREWKQVLLLSTASGGIVVTDAAAGRVRITIPKAETAKLAPGRYQDQARVSTGGEADTMWTGEITVGFSPF